MKRVKEKVCAISRNIENVFIQLSVHKKTFFALFMIYMIGILAIIRANHYYYDDLGRASWGYRDWGWSRYIPNFLSTFIHGSKHLTDISPLTQIIAIALIAVAGVIILFTVTKREKFNFLELFMLVPLGLSPYYLECISYKFDCIYMSLSVLAMFFPILFRNKNKIIYMIVIILSTIVMCTSYQASAGIFPMFVALIGLNMWIEKEKLKEVLKFVCCSAGGYLLGLVIFRKCLMQMMVDYTSPAMPTSDTFIDKVIHNYKTFFEYILKDFKSEWILLIAIISVAFVIASVIKSERNKAITVLISIAVWTSMLLLSFGVYAFLDKPIYEPRAMYGFGVFITLLIVQIMSTKKMYLSKIVCLALCWLFFVFASTYGNALYMQGMYTDFRITEAIDDIKEIEDIQSSEIVYLQVNGTIGYAPSIEKMPQDYQMLKRLVPITFRGPGSTWGLFGITNYYGLDNVASWPYTDLATLDLPIVEDNIYHTIRADDKHVLIELK